MGETLGIVGLGRMGLPIAARLKAAGYSVAACETDPTRSASAKDLGISIHPSAREVGAASTIVIVLVGFDDEVSEVVTGPDGLLAGMAKGGLIGVASTVRPATMDALAEATAAAGIALVDIPLCRGEGAAENGTLLIMGGGADEDLVRMAPVMQAFASDVVKLGALGAGQVGKMINNLLLWSCYCADWEGLKLGEALGVDPDRMREALMLSSGANWALETWTRDRPMPWAERDMSIVMDHADLARLPMPLSGLVREMVRGIKIERGLPPPPRL